MCRVKESVTQNGRKSELYIFLISAKTQPSVDEKTVKCVCQLVVTHSKACYNGACNKVSMQNAAQREDKWRIKKWILVN